MASLVGAVFQEYSTLNPAERNKAVNEIGTLVSYVNAFVVGAANINGTADNDLYFVDANSGNIHETVDGGNDIVVSSTDIVLDKNIETLILTGSDGLFAEGNDLDNVIAGSTGDDTIEGGKGDDMLLGGEGDDYLKAQQGEDTMCGGGGDDTIVGNSGADHIDGGNDNDVLIGNNGRDYITGGLGFDSIEGGQGDDTLYGNEGNDTILGGQGEDLIFAGQDNDSVAGGAGRDTIVGGQGFDTLTGGSGNDVFYFGFAGNDPVHGEAIITDFRAGVDFINVEAGLETIVDMVASATNNGNGDAVITIGNKDVVLEGIDENNVNAGFFHIV